MSHAYQPHHSFDASGVLVPEGHDPVQDGAWSPSKVSEGINPRMKSLSATTARQRFAESAPSFVATLDAAKAARFRASTMLIPSPSQIRDVIARIPVGETKSLKELKEALARESGADVVCPFTTRVGWILVAEVAEENLAEGIVDNTPWWRIVKDKRPEPKLPGGSERQRSLLALEGTII